VELRQYTLHPGGRDVLIELFEREFIEPQQEAGMEIIGTFVDLDDPNRFVWLRGFSDMESRANALATFYGGPIWKEHRDAANATMIDSDDVLLLRPVIWPPVAASGYLATIHLLREPFDTATALDPGAAWLTTEYVENTYPALPVRTGVNALVSLAPVTSDTAHPPSVSESFTTEPLNLRLAPTRRSALRDL
jgi:hypothetical protein